TRLETFFLFQDEMVALVSPNHPLASRKYLKPEDFAEETMFVYSLPDPSDPEDDIYVLRHVLRPAGILPRLSEVRLTEAMVEMVAAGLGISVIAGWAAAPYIRGGRLLAIPVTRNGLPRDWYAAALRTRPQPPHLMEFVNLLRNGTDSLAETS